MLRLALFSVVILYTYLNCFVKTKLEWLYYVGARKQRLGAHTRGSSGCVGELGAGKGKEGGREGGGERTHVLCFKYTSIERALNAQPLWGRIIVPTGALVDGPLILYFRPKVAERVF